MQAVYGDTYNLAPKIKRLYTDVPSIFGRYNQNMTVKYHKSYIDDPLTSIC